MKSDVTLFEEAKIRRVYDEQAEIWFFSVVDIIRVLTGSADPGAYWRKLKQRLKAEGSEVVTHCHGLKLTDYWKNHDIKQGQEYAILTNIIHQEWSDLSVKQHKTLKGITSQNLRDHMTEAELIFTALAELSTRQIAESMNATGLEENTVAGKRGGGIARRARKELETRTGRAVVSRESGLPPGSEE